MTGTSLLVWSLCGGAAGSGPGGIAGTQSVVPVLVGPMATLIPILAGAGLGLLAYIARSLKAQWPKALVIALLTVGYYVLESNGYSVWWLAGMGWFSEFAAVAVMASALVLAAWGRRISLVLVAGVVAGLCYFSANHWFLGNSVSKAPPAAAGQEWAAFRGDGNRAGQVADSPDPTTDEAIWHATPKAPNKSDAFKAFWSSPAVVGDRVYVAACETGLFSEHGAIYSFNADTGEVVWCYAPNDFRATYSSPSVAYKHKPDGTVDYTDGYVVCGEGMHYCENARVVCLNFKGELLWQYRTRHHVECSPCIANGRAYIGAGEDGYFCFDLEPKQWDNKAWKYVKPAWHVGGIDYTAKNYHDAEPCPIVEDGVLYAGLGKNDGQAVLALDAATGNELWRTNSDYPVYCPPAIGHRIRIGADGKRDVEKLMFIAMGNANVLQSAEEVKVTEPARMKGRNFSQKDIDRTMKNFRTDGEVWCYNLTAIKAGAASRPDGAEIQPEWKLKVPQSVLGLAFAGPEVAVNFGDVTGAFTTGETVTQEGSGAKGSFLSLNNSTNTIAIRWLSGAFDEGHAIRGESSKARAAVTGATTETEGRLYFGSWDGCFYSYSTNKQLLAKHDFHSPMPNFPAIGNDYIYVATKGGTLYCIDKRDLEPLWQTELGQKQVSSPAIAHGHIYIGTNDDGLRCLGRAKPIPPVWNQGTIGGMSDRTPISEPAAGKGGVNLSDRYPPKDKPDETFRLTGAVMPLPQLMQVTEMVQAKAGPGGKPASQPESRQVDKLLRFMYAPVSHEGKFELLKLAPFKTIHEAVERKDGSDKVLAKDLHLQVIQGARRTTINPVVWAAPFERAIVVPPAAVADQIYVVEGGSATTQADRPTLHALDLDGKEKWKTDLAPGGTGEFTIDGRYIYIWRGPAALACVDREENGKVLWSRQCPGGNSVGVPSAGSGLVTVTTASNLSVLDAVTGAILWSDVVPSRNDASGPAAPTAGPLRVGSAVLVPTDKGVYRIALAGGAIQWHAAIGRVCKPLVADGEKLVAVAEDGKLHVLSVEDGQPWRLRDEYDLVYDSAAKGPSGSPTTAPESLVERMILSPAPGLYQIKESGLNVLPTSKEFLVEDRRCLRLNPLVGDWRVLVDRDNDVSVAATSQPDEYLLKYKSGSEKVVRLRNNEWLSLADGTGPQGEKTYKPFARIVRVSADGGKQVLQDSRGRPVPYLPISNDWCLSIAQDAVRSLTVTSEGATLAYPDGRNVTLRQKDSFWFSNERPATRMVTVAPRRVVPISGIKGRMARVDTTITPVLAGDRIVFGGVKEGASAKTDLMLLSLPERYQAESLPPGPPGDSAQTPEAVVIDPKTWCEAAVLGDIQQPLVLVEGNAYTATSELGLIFLAKQK